MIDYAQQISPDVLVLSLVGLVAVVVIAAFGRRLHLSVGNVHAELTPNGGSTARDAIDRIEVTMRDAVERIEKLEQARPVTTAIVVTPATQEPG